MSGKRARAVALAAVVVVSLAGCGPSGPSGKSSATPSTPTVTSSAPAPSQSPQARNVIVIGSCDASTDTRVLHFLEPAGWIVKSREFAAASPQYASLGGCGVADNTPGSAMRWAFDKDFQHLAAQQGPEELPPPDDAPYHTGTIAADGGFTDLSGVQDEDSSGFSAATQQSAGAYSPDGKLYFVSSDDNDVAHLMVADPNGGKPQEVRKLRLPGSGFNVVSDGTSTPDFLYFIPGDSTSPHVYDSRFHEAVCPDGNGFWFSDTDSRLYYGKPTDTKGPSIELNVGEGFNPISCIDHTSFYDFSNNTISRVTIAGGTPKRHNLLPKTKGEISQPVVSSDGKNIAFLLKKNNTFTLYTASTDGTSTPQKSHFPVPVGPIKVLGWEDVAGLN